MSRECLNCGFLAANRKERKCHCCCCAVDEESARQHYEELMRERWDVIDYDDYWLITDRNGMTYTEIKPIKRTRCKLPRRVDHFAK